jgi:hypothetical protein
LEICVTTHIRLIDLVTEFEEMADVSSSD